VARAVAGAALVIEAGDAPTFNRVGPKGAVLLWPGTRRLDGDWYVQPPTLHRALALAGALAGVAWTHSTCDIPAELGPKLDDGRAGGAPRAARPAAPHGHAVPARRSAPRGDRAGASTGGVPGRRERRCVSSAGGGARGLAPGGRSGERGAVPSVTYETPNGTAVLWRWTGAGDPRSAVLSLNAERGSASTRCGSTPGRAELRLAPGVYRYAASDGGGVERGVVAVDTYSDEWRPAAPVLAPNLARRVAADGRGLAGRWWLFVVAIAAFAAEWAWRRREGLP